jgi:WG repeat protein
MDSTGTVRIKPAFDEADAFAEERARVSVDKKLGFIDPDGTFVARPQFEAATSFHEGLARVKIGDKWGFIDKAGQVVIQPMFEDSSSGISADTGSFYEGLARMPADNRLSQCVPFQHTLA